MLRGFARATPAPFCLGFGQDARCWAYGRRRGCFEGRRVNDECLGLSPAVRAAPPYASLQQSMAAWLKYIVDFVHGRFRGAVPGGLLECGLEGELVELLL